MAEKVTLGVEKLRYAPASAVGVIAPEAWKQIDNITMGSVNYTEGSQTKTDIMVEDKDVALFSVYAPAEGDIFTFAVLDQNPTLLQELYNVVWTAATSTMAFKAKKKIANLAFELTSRPVNGFKTVLTFFNTEVQTTSDGAITKDSPQSKVLTATIKSYRPDGETEDFIYSKTTLTAAGAVVNSTVV